MTLLFLCFLFFADEAPKEDQVSSIQKEINSIDTDLERLSARLEKLKQNSNQLVNEIEGIELQRAIINKSIEKFVLEVDEAKNQISENEATIAQLNEKSQGQQRWLQGRLRNLYKRGGLGYSQLFLKQSRLSELINAYHYAKILTEKDHEMITAFQKTILDLKNSKLKLEEAQANAIEHQKSLTNEERKLKQLILIRNRKLNAMKKEERQNQRRMEQLELDREELHMMVRQITENDPNPLKYQIDINRYKGKLDWPSTGKLLRRFGIYRDPEFGTKRKQNGIHLATPKGKNVKAIYSGKVVYADWFKSYGNLVIIDHGSKVISFYAHCDRFKVVKGDIVEKGQAVAVSGDTGSLDGPLLHFEIRNETKPVNPLNWLKKRARR